MSTPILPFWFKQRQLKAEPAGEQTLKLSGPNIPEAFVSIRREGDRWALAVRPAPDAALVASAHTDRPSEQEAWDAAFEIYRQHAVV